MTEPTAHVDVIDDELIVTGDPAIHSRRVRLFFRSVLGADLTPDGWRIARRDQRLKDLIIRVNTFLTSNGFAITRGEIADREVELALERGRSFDRTREEATAWKAGSSIVDPEEVLNRLADLGWKPERVLRSHQLRDATHALAAVNHANFSVPGSGKTVTALAVASLHLAVGTIEVIVVVGPLASFEPWETETEAALGERIRPQRVRGQARERRGRYAAAKAGDLLLLSYATAAADRPSLIDLADRVNIMLVVDESHRVKRFKGGVWAPALVELAEHARVRMILSGTPMPRGPLDLYTQLNILWPGRELVGTRNSFAARADRDFPALIGSITPFTTRTAKSELGLQPYRVVRHDVALTGTQADVYQLIENRFRDRIAGAETWRDKLDALRRARPIRLLQAASNPGLLNRPDDAFVLPVIPSASPTLMERLARFTENDQAAKSLAALDIVADLSAQNRKVVCWSNFIGNLDAFRKLVVDLLGIPTYQIDGRVPTSDDPIADRPDTAVAEDDTRERILHEFLHSPGTAVLIANPASCSESISLHHACHDAIYLDRTYDAALFLQSIDRIHRLGLPPDADVSVHLLRATVGGRPTIDHLVEQSLSDKEERMRELLEGSELHPLDQRPEDAEGDERDLTRLIRYLIGEEDSESAV